MRLVQRTVKSCITSLPPMHKLNNFYARFLWYLRHHPLQFGTSSLTGTPATGWKKLEGASSRWNRVTAGGGWGVGVADVLIIAKPQYNYRRRTHSSPITNSSNTSDRTDVLETICYGEIPLARSRAIRDYTPWTNTPFAQQNLDMQWTN